MYSNILEKMFYTPNKYTCFKKADTESSVNIPVITEKLRAIATAATEAGRATQFRE